MEDKITKKIIITRISIVLIVVTLMVGIFYGVGRSFGFFKYIKKGDIVNIITIGGIRDAVSINILSEDDTGLKLQEAYPMYDSEGLALEPFEFEITNNLKSELAFSLSVQSDEEKQALCTTTKEIDGVATQVQCPVLTTNYIKYAYKINDGEYSEPRILSELDDIVIDNYKLASQETVKISVIIWIDVDAGNEIQGSYFAGKLILQQSQYKAYAIGEEITLKDGSKWHVLETSSINDNTITLLSDYNLNSDGTYNTECQGIEGNADSYICSPMTFNSENNIYEGSNAESIINNYASNLLISLPGTKNVTMPTAEQIATAEGEIFYHWYLELKNSWISTTNYWTRTGKNDDNSLLFCIKGSDKYIYDWYASDNNIYGIRPVITTLKTNILDV